MYMRCVNCGQPVVGDIAICPQCARLVIQKDEEKERFMEFIRREAQATISKDDASMAVKPEVESEVEPLAPASDEHNQDNQQSTEEVTAKQIAGEFLFFVILVLLFVIILEMIFAQTS